MQFTESYTHTNSLLNSIYNNIIQGNAIEIGYKPPVMEASEWVQMPDNNQILPDGRSVTTRQYHHSFALKKTRSSMALVVAETSNDYASIDTSEMGKFDIDIVKLAVGKAMSQAELNILQEAYRAMQAINPKSLYSNELQDIVTKLLEANVQSTEYIAFHGSGTNNKIARKETDYKTTTTASRVGGLICGLFDMESSAKYSYNDKVKVVHTSLGTQMQGWFDNTSWAPLKDYFEIANEIKTARAVYLKEHYLNQNAVLDLVLSQRVYAALDAKPAILQGVTQITTNITMLAQIQMMLSGIVNIRSSLELDRHCDAVNANGMGYLYYNTPDVLSYILTPAMTNSLIVDTSIRNKVQYIVESRTSGFVCKVPNGLHKFNSIVSIV